MSSKLAKLVRVGTNIVRRFGERMCRFHGGVRAHYSEQLVNTKFDLLFAVRRLGTHGEAAVLGIRDLLELVQWIVDLRVRLDAGALSHVAPVELGYGTGRLSCDVMVRTMLADLNHLQMLPSGGRERQARLMILLGDFGQLRLRIG